MSSFDDVHAAANGRWREILTALGIEARHLVNKHGPCPGCGGADRFRFDDKDGRGSFVCGQGGDTLTGDGFALLSHVHGWDKADTLRQVAQCLGMDGRQPKPKGELIQLKAKAEERRLREEEKTRLKQEEAAKRAESILAAAKGDPGKHKYALRKGLSLGPLVKRRRGPWGQAGSWKDFLLVPLYDVQGRLASIQTIDPDGVKEFMKGGRTAGCFHSLGKVRGTDGVVLVGEGLATVAAVHSVTHYPALAAMSAGNLEAVVMAALTLAPDSMVLILADNDIKPDGKNPGVKAATKVAVKLGTALAVPDLDGRPCDFWDVWNERGPDAVASAIEQALDTYDAAPVPESQDQEQALAIVAPSRDCPQCGTLGEGEYESCSVCGHKSEKPPEVAEATIDAAPGDSQGMPGTGANELALEVPKDDAAPAGKEVIEAALNALADDPGALFESHVLELLRTVRAEDPAHYARIRSRAKAGKVSLTEFDRLTKSSEDDEAGQLELFPEVIPWPDPVNGNELLNEIAAIIAQHVIADAPTIRAATLWAVFTWFIDEVQVAPIANITAPEKRCGKTIMLGVLGRLACRPLTVSNIAPAALFRSLEMWRPTLLVDEVDAFLAAQEEARGILNAGFTRDSAYVIRCVGDGHTPARFDVWGAKALCGIGKIADTLQDRSIPLRLRRKLPGESTVKLRHTDDETFSTLREKIARFYLDNRDAVRRARPAEIEGLNDRANDCWEPLLIVAELAGEEWPRAARSAAISLHGMEEEAPSIGAELLADIKTVFDSKRVTKIFSCDLLEALAADDEAPWATWNRGKPMTPRQLANRLADFGIKSKDVRIGLDVRRGFNKSDFEDAWGRYMPKSATPSSSATPLQPNDGAGSGPVLSATPTVPVADQKARKASNGAACSVVALGAGDTPEGEISVTSKRPCADGSVPSDDDREEFEL